MQTLCKLFLSLMVFFFVLISGETSTYAQEIWGMTKYGGRDGKGVIFKMDENASEQEAVFSFETVQSPEGGLTEYHEGVFYGMSSKGGVYDNGVIYQFDASNGSFTKILDFDGDVKGKDGTGRMIYASNGKFYGMTVNGGLYDQGILFEFVPETNSFIKHIDFDGEDKGAEPLGSLIEGSDGKLYGTTSMGGAMDEGVLFSFDIYTNILSKIIDFDLDVNGAHPMGDLTEASDGMLYGMTRWGGNNNFGLIFKLNPAISETTVLFEFDGNLNGRYPHGSLTEAKNGKLYGMTPFGGDYDEGVLFEFDPRTIAFQVRYEFTGGLGSGRNPLGSLILANNGKLYGLTSPEEHLGEMLFEFNPDNGNFQLLDSPPIYPREVSMYSRSLTLGSNNKLYFILNADQNDIRNENNVYEYDAEVKGYTGHYKFSGIYTGEFPHGSLFQDVNGILYGTTNTGGIYNQGIIFKFDPNTNSFRKIMDFDGESMGAKPNGGIVGAENGKLYGLTMKGGLYDQGVLYELDPVSGQFLKLLDFDEMNGKNPDGDLVKANNGKLYGTTPIGGANNEGVLFELDPDDGAFRKIIDYKEDINGKNPLSNALVAASNGFIYGTTLYGGSAGEGILFEYNPETEEMQRIFDYGTSIPGEVPTNLTKGTDNKIYAHVGPGYIVRFDPEDLSYDIVVDDYYLINPLAGRLLHASNGNLYGMDRGLIWYRATDFTGSVHEFDLIGGNYNKLMDFGWENGSNPENSTLIQLKSTNGPVARCINTTLYLDENGEAILEPISIDGGSEGEEIELSLSKVNFTCNDIGENTVTLTATDVNGLQSFCNAIVVVADTIAPAIVARDLEIYLDENGNATIEADEVDNGSTDVCGIQSLMLSKKTFTCENLGENIIEFEVTDINGNRSITEVKVFVVDTLSPEITCPSDLTVYLDPYNEEYTFENTEYNATAVDNCTIEQLYFSINADNAETTSSLEGYKFEAGTYEIIWTAVDNSNNVAVCSSMLNIEKRPTSLSINGTKVGEEQDIIYVEVVLNDELISEGIEGRTIVFSAAGDTESAVTNIEGIAFVELPVTGVGAETLSVSITFEEDEVYLGSTTSSGVVTGNGAIAENTVNVYPNPFSEKLTFKFVSPENTEAQIDIYDPAGRLVRTIFHQQVISGMVYTIEYRPQYENVNYYLYRMKIGNNIYNGKVMYRK